MRTRFYWISQFDSKHRISTQKIYISGSNYFWHENWILIQKYEIWWKKRIWSKNMKFHPEIGKLIQKLEIWSINMKFDLKRNFYLIHIERLISHSLHHHHEHQRIGRIRIVHQKHREHHIKLRISIGFAIYIIFKNCESLKISIKLPCLSILE